MGLTSDKTFRLGHFVIEVTIAVYQFVGIIVSDQIETLKMCSTISAISNEHERNSHTGI